MCAGDLDDLLAYKTDVRVKVRHKVVGGCYYGVILLVAAYIATYQFYWSGGWGDLEELQGSLRATVHLNEVATPIADLPYCTQAGTKRTPPAKRLPCMSADEVVTIREGAPLSKVIGTRLSTQYESRNSSCGELEYGCERWTNTRRIDAFVGDVENATVLLQHAVAPASEASIGREVIDTFRPRPNPFLYGGSGGLRRYATACTGLHAPHPACPAAGDLFHVHDLLAVSGVALDAPVLEADGTQTSRRASGLTLRVNLEYNDALHYAYRISANPIEAKVVTADWLTTTERVVFDLHGIQLLFAQTGGVRLPHARTIILTLVSGLALLSVAKTVADAFLLYLAPRRKDYALFVETITPDFGPETDQERQTLERVLERKRLERDELLGRSEPRPPPPRTDRGPLLPTGGPSSSSSAPQAVEPMTGGGEVTIALTPVNAPPSS